MDTWGSHTHRGQSALRELGFSPPVDLSVPDTARELGVGVGELGFLHQVDTGRWSLQPLAHLTNQ